MRSIFALLAFVLIHINVNGQHAHEGHETQHQHKDHLQVLVDHYMEAKDALVQDDFEAAKEHLGEFGKEVKSSGEMNHHSEHSEKHEKHHAAMVAAVDSASVSEDIAELRGAFSAISAELMMAVENQGYETILYKQYCPMYEGGSSWLSKEEKVENPFFGQAMHSCGDVVEKLD